MLDKLQAIYDRYQYLEEQISDPDVVQDMDRYRKINKEYKDLQPVVDAFLEYRNVLSNLDLARFTLQEDDPEMQELAREEIALLSPRLKELEESLKTLLIPKDPEDSKDVIFEIRSGTGGDEASLFAGDLYRMYTRYFDSKGWKTEVLEVNEGSVGGYNKVVLEVQGKMSSASSNSSPARTGCSGFPKPSPRAGCTLLRQPLSSCPNWRWKT